MPVLRFFTHKSIAIACLAALTLLVLGWQYNSAQAGNPAAGFLQSPTATPPVAPASGQTAGSDRSTDIQNSNCIMCHQYEKLNGVTQDSLQVSLTVDEQAIDQSLHGQAGIKCVSCHDSITTYPHSGKEQVTCAQCHEQRGSIVAALPFENRREMRVVLNESCRNCHNDVFSSNAIHTAVAQSGAVNPPLCSDCHGSHDLQHPSNPPERISLTCGRCHTAVLADFQAGAHNSADPASQTCVDCHTAHHLSDSQAGSVAATPVPPQQDQPLASSYVDDWNVTCTMCHQYPNLIGRAEDSSTISLTVDNHIYGQSVHAQEGIGCPACHESIAGYPHDETSKVSCTTCHGQADMNAEIIADLPYESTRAIGIEVNQACRNCHEEEFEDSADSMHTESLKNGNLQSPLCTDCHGSHDIQASTEPTSKSVDLCADCHASVHSSYQASVHGKAFATEGNLDAPACVDCHDGHAVKGPGNKSFRPESVGMCLKCHQDPEIMERNGISAELFDGTVDNYHNTPISLFEQAGSADTAQLVVCSDCHGSHTIQESDNTFSSVNPENLTATCQKCHPDASSRFANSGPAHSGTAVKQVSGVNWFNRIYTFSIVAVFGCMIGYLFLDGRKSRREKRAALDSDQGEE